MKICVALVPFYDKRRCRKLFIKLLFYKQLLTSNAAFWLNFFQLSLLGIVMLKPHQIASCIDRLCDTVEGSRRFIKMGSSVH